MANDRAFPAGDCRNDLGLTNVTDAQVNNFIHEFDTNIYPKESATFSVPPPRDGHNAILPGLIPNLPSSEYKGEGDNIVTLVDNVRDANYYEPTTPDGQTYIAGFFYSVFNEYFDRNVMTIDAFDWLHRTGANPPDDSTDPDYQACSEELEVDPSRLLGLPRPHLYEVSSPTSTSTCWSTTRTQTRPRGSTRDCRTGPRHSSATSTLCAPEDPDADSHIKCFLGFSPPASAGRRTR